MALRGRGAGGADEGPPPLHLAVAAPSAKAAEDARRLAQSLIDTVRKDHAAHAPPQARGHGGQGLGLRAQSLVDTVRKDHAAQAPQQARGPGLAALVPLDSTSCLLLPAFAGWHIENARYDLAASAAAAGAGRIASLSFVEMMHGRKNLHINQMHVGSRNAECAKLPLAHVCGKEHMLSLGGKVFSDSRLSTSCFACFSSYTHNAYEKMEHMQAPPAAASQAPPGAPPPYAQAPPAHYPGQPSYPAPPYPGPYYPPPGAPPRPYAAPPPPGAYPGAYPGYYPPPGAPPAPFSGQPPYHAPGPYPGYYPGQQPLPGGAPAQGPPGAPVTLPLPRQGPAPAGPAAAPAQASGGDGGAGAEEQRRKRFREFKEEPRQVLPACAWGRLTRLFAPAGVERCASLCGLLALVSKACVPCRCPNCSTDIEAASCRALKRDARCPQAGPAE